MVARQHNPLPGNTHNIQQSGGLMQILTLDVVEIRYKNQD